MGDVTDNTVRGIHNGITGGCTIDNQMIGVLICRIIPQGIHHQIAIHASVIFIHSDGFVITHRSSVRRNKGNCALISQIGNGRVTGVVPNGSRIDKYVR